MCCMNSRFIRNTTNMLISSLSRSVFPSWHTSLVSERIRSQKLSAHKAPIWPPEEEAMRDTYCPQIVVETTSTPQQHCQVEVWLLVVRTSKNNSKNIIHFHRNFLGKTITKWSILTFFWPWSPLTWPPFQYPSGGVLGTACWCNFGGVTIEVDLTSWLDKLSLVKWFEQGPEAGVTSQLDKRNLSTWLVKFHLCSNASVGTWFGRVSFDQTVPDHCDLCFVDDGEEASLKTQSNAFIVDSSNLGRWQVHAGSPNAHQAGRLNRTCVARACANPPFESYMRCTRLRQPPSGCVQSKILTKKNVRVKIVRLRQVTARPRP